MKFILALLWIFAFLSILVSFFIVFLAITSSKINNEAIGLLLTALCIAILPYLLVRCVTEMTKD
jgi:hypothetical protein